MVLGWLLEVPGMRIVEESSEPDQPIRWFETLDQLAIYLQQNPHPILSAWSPSIGGVPMERKVTFVEKVQKELGARGRTVSYSPAFINIRGGWKVQCSLAASRISRWSEKGARYRADCSDAYLSEIDWAKLRSTVRAVERRISKAAPARLGSQPIMPDAFSKYRSGEIALWNWGDVVRHPSPAVTLI